MAVGLAIKTSVQYEGTMRCHRCYIKLVQRLCPCCDNERETQPGGMGLMNETSVQLGALKAPGLTAVEAAASSTPS